jgi:hypothetical protein
VSAFALFEVGERGGRLAAIAGGFANPDECVALTGGDPPDRNELFDELVQHLVVQVEFASERLQGRALIRRENSLRALQHVEEAAHEDPVGREPPVIPPVYTVPGSSSEECCELLVW